MKKWVVLVGLIAISAIGFGFLGKKKPKSFAIPLPEYVARHFHSPNFPTKDNPTTLEGFELGRRLFYDKRLSKTNTISCGSCHLPQFAFSDTARFSKGIHDSLGDKNSMSLANISWSGKFFWDGRAANLKDQIHDPVIDSREMGNTWEDVVNTVKNDDYYKSAFRAAFPKQSINATTIKNALEQFVANIYSFQSKYDDYYYNRNTALFTEQEKKGLKLFNSKAQCINCHNTVLFTNNQFLNNGLDSIPNLGHFNATGVEEDRGLMKTPTLRNVALTPPYMHDGRFKTLDEVIDFYNTKVNPNSTNLDFRMERFIRPGGLGLNHEEKQALKAFLHTLTDTQFIQNKYYSDPWL